MAVAVVLPPSVNSHAPVPKHTPLHPVKLLPEAGVAVRVTAVPELKGAVQVEPQLMPDGLLATVPLPAPVVSTVNTHGPVIA